MPSPAMVKIEIPITFRTIAVIMLLRAKGFLLIPVMPSRRAFTKEKKPIIKLPPPIRRAKK